MRFRRGAGPAQLLEDSRALGVAWLPLLGHDVHKATGTRDGTLTLVWDDGAVVEVLDSWPNYESYTVSGGPELIVV